ncbi:MAG: carbon-nitrogen family hydrolase [Candidatus Schekmanbacteria bacterium]|nr:carbon-nitrogen family hydrolase [Candidatus Schekmanbacteria bacterium]
MRKIKVAAVQMDVHPQDVWGNLNRALSFMELAAQQKAQIICLPELFTTSFDYALIQNTDTGRIKNAIAEKARALGVFILSGTMAEKSPSGIYNTAHLFNDKGNIIGQYRKAHLFPLIQEPEHFSPGQDISVFNTELARIGILICYDLRFPESARKLALNRAEIIFVPAQFPHPRIEHWKTLLRARAIENQLFIAGVNRVGQDPANKFFGASCLINPWGEVMAELTDKEDLMVVDIDLDRIYEIRKQLPCLENRRVDLY